MIDPETTRQAAHVLLDAASVQSDTSIDPDTRDDMWALAFDRFKDIEAIRLTQNDETGAVQLDIRRLATATLLGRQRTAGLAGGVQRCRPGRADREAARSDRR